ncbi:Aminodeoxychorismate lyase, partial [Cryomyces antarcticus]
MSGSPDFELLTSLRYDPQLCTIRDDTLARCHAEVSIEPNSPFYVLELHKDRLLAAAAYFKERSSSWSSVPDPLEWSTMMTDALSMIEDMQNSGGPQRPLKIRILCTPAGIHKVDVSATPPVSLETLYPSFNFMEAPERPGRSASVAWMVRLDTKPTAPSDYTMFKTTSRDMYDEARKRAGIVSFAVQEEVLLYNHNNEIME